MTMKERIMIVEGDTGEIISYNGGGGFDITWKTAIDDIDSSLDCTVLKAEGVIVIAEHGWMIMGEEDDLNADASYLYVRTDEEYANEPNPWSTDDKPACEENLSIYLVTK